MSEIKPFDVRTAFERMANQRLPMAPDDLRLDSLRQYQLRELLEKTSDPNRRREIEGLIGTKMRRIYQSAASNRLMGPDGF